MSQHLFRLISCFRLNCIVVGKGELLSAKNTIHCSRNYFLSNTSPNLSNSTDRWFCVLLLTW